MIKNIKKAKLRRNAFKMDKYIGSFERYPKCNDGIKRKNSTGSLSIIKRHIYLIRAKTRKYAVFQGSN